MKHILTCLLALSLGLKAETISKRASEIDSRAKEYPEIDFVFTDKDGKPQDMQNASVDLKGDDKPAHSSVTPGGAAVKDKDGKFIHEAVWKYLCNHPVDQTGYPTPADPNCVKDQRK